jgi:hypothetical protein
MQAMEYLSSKLREVAKLAQNADETSHGSSFEQSFRILLIGGLVELLIR